MSKRKKEYFAKRKFKAYGGLFKRTYSNREEAHSAGADYKGRSKTGIYATLGISIGITLLGLGILDILNGELASGSGAVIIGSISTGRGIQDGLIYTDHYLKTGYI